MVLSHNDIIKLNIKDDEYDIDMLAQLLLSHVGIILHLTILKP